MSRIKLFLSRRSEIQIFFLIFLFALTIRAVYLFLWIDKRPEIYQNTRFDGAELGSVAKNLYEGYGFSSPFESGSTPTSFFSPLIPLVFSGLMRLSGGPSGKTALLIGCLHIVISALAVSFYYACAKHMENKSQDMPKGAGIIVALVFALWPESILRNYNTWYFVWQELGLAVLVFMGMLWLDRPTHLHAASIGLVAGSIANINPTPVPIYLLILFLPLFDRKYWNWRHLRRIVLSLSLAVLLITPWTLRNFIVFGRFIPMRSNYGIELHQGNNPNGSIRQNNTSLHPVLQQAEIERYRILGEGQYSQWAMQQAITYVKNHPLITGVRIIERAYVLWLTDLSDRWSWFPDDPKLKWWNSGAFNVLLTITTIISAIIPLLMVIYGIVTKKSAKLPYLLVFLGILIFMPLPYYFTTASVVYMQIVRTWLAIWGTIVVVKILQNRKHTSSFTLGNPTPS